VIDSPPISMTRVRVLTIAALLVFSPLGKAHSRARRVLRDLSLRVDDHNTC
jgi:hypothetical protein